MSNEHKPAREEAKLTLRPFEDTDIALMERWLVVPHVMPQGARAACARSHMFRYLGKSCCASLLLTSGVPMKQI